VCVFSLDEVIDCEGGSSKLLEILYTAVEGRRFLRNVKLYSPDN